MEKAMEKMVRQLKLWLVVFVICAGCTMDMNGSSYDVAPVSPTVVSPDNRSDHALDALVVIDTSTYLQISAVGTVGKFGGYGSVSDAAVKDVIDFAAAELYKATSIRMVLNGIVRVSLGTDLNPDEASVLMKQYVGKLFDDYENQPEVFVIISKMGNAWVKGGFLQDSVVPLPDSDYCNEFQLLSDKGPIPQQRTASLVVDWDNYYAGCGYDYETFPGTMRISDKPTHGECRNNPADTCVLRSDGAYYQCQSLTTNKKSDRTFFRAGIILHEFLHAADLKEYGHYFSPSCNAAMVHVPGYDTIVFNPDDNDVHFSMCPLTFDEARASFKGCSP
jgi:hypothetical protein